MTHVAARSRYHFARAALISGTLQSPLHLEPGTVFGGDFKVVAPLERGGMGAVYVVEQLSTHKRRALKLMLASRASDPALRKRFEQEARVGAMIPSEHVVDVTAAGVDAASQIPWLAMELLEGEDLASFVARRGAVSPGEVYEVFAQLCHALAAAHAIPVVHRDLKPGNIFLARPRLAEARFVVKVLDFGIAKIVGDTPSTTAAVGTPLWMAPEQTKARATVDPAADVWALGLIAFQLLTGRLYWESANDPEAQAMTVMREVLFDPIVPASERARSLGVGEKIPPGFDAWFAKCVVRDVAARLPSAKEAWAALAEVLAPGRLARSGSMPDIANVNLVTGPRAGAVAIGAARTPHPDALASTMLSTPAPVQPPTTAPPAPAIGTTLGTSELASRPDPPRSRAFARVVIAACVVVAVIAIGIVAIRYGSKSGVTSAASGAASTSEGVASPSPSASIPASQVSSAAAATSQASSASATSSSSAGASALTAPTAGSSHGLSRTPPRGSGATPNTATPPATPPPQPTAPPKPTSSGSTPYLL